MTTPIELIVGLGNPGKDYAKTRHNAGSWFVEDLADQFDVNLRHETKYHGLHGIAQIDHHPVHLLIPSTYMNNSGRSVQALMSYHKISPQALLVAHDEIDLPVGIVKLKFDGGDGGHNGTKDIIRQLNTRQFYRLRIGVAHPGNSKDVVDYVLKKPSKADKQKIDNALIEVEEVLPLIIKGEMQKAMHKLHSE